MVPGRRNGSYWVAMSKKKKAFVLFDQGKRPSDEEVKALGLCPKTTYNYYQLWKHSPGAQPFATTGTKPSTAVAYPSTEAVSQATFLKLVPQTLSLPLTPNVFMSYLCALKKGFKRDLGAWIDLACADFWTDRGIDFYAEVSGIKSSE